MKKLLFINPNKKNGCIYHRIEVPMYTINKHAINFDISSADNLDNIDSSFLQGIDLIIFNRFNGIGDDATQLERLKALKIPFIFDVDDYWELPDSHLMAKQYKEENAPARLKEYVKFASCVTTTHSYFAGIISKLNKNVEVLYNAVDPDQPQWNITDKPIDKDNIKFGWIGGVHHFEDIQLLRDGLKKLFSSDIINAELVMGGFTKDSIIWETMLSMFSNYGKFKHSVLESLDVYNYGYLYDHIDVALIPLVDNKFNNCKSQLKIIEAGFKKKPIICSKVMPYLYDVNTNHGFYVEPKRNHSDWYDAIKKLSKQPELIKEMGENLYNLVSKKYDIHNVNEKRTQIYNYYAK